MSEASAKTGPCDVAVVGGGPAGLLTALLCARAGAATTLVAPPPPPDARTTALLEGSVEILREAGVWETLKPHAAPLTTLRIIDAGKRLFRAPEATFHAAELGLDAFGWNVPNATLAPVLLEAFTGAGGRAVETAARAVRTVDDAVIIDTEQGETIVARVVAAADGKNSIAREAAGISFKSRRAPQDALAFAVAHERPHENVSTELHTEEGPFTLVPMPGNRSSVVWAAAPARAEMLRALSSEALSEAVTEASGWLLGRLAVDGPVGRFPIVIGAATRLAKRRTMLVGEAGHVLPPIGAQGLNLGVRDAAAVARIIGRSLAAGEDPGGEEALGAYVRARAVDAWSRTAATDLLNRSLLTDLLPLHAARGIGLAAISRIGPLRRFVMREGLIGGPAFGR